MELMISIIIPAYNAERFIKESITSVLNQTYQDFEIIVIDDGSSDRTENICKKIIKADSRVHYYRKKNEGVSSARNKGLELAKGKYIMFLDSDDMLTSNALLVLLKEIKKGKYDAVYGKHAYYYGKRILERTIRVKSGEYIYSDLKQKLLDDGTMTGMLFGSVCGVLYRKEIISNSSLLFNLLMSVNEDGFFNLQFIRNGARIKVINDPYVYIYRQWKLTKKNKLEKDINMEKASLIIKDYIEKNGEQDDFRIQLLRRNVSVAFWNGLKINETRVNVRDAYFYLNDLFKDINVTNGMKYLDYSNMGKYKRILCWMIRNKHILLFYLSVKYIYPAVKRIVKR